jgi:hypothetical protein
MREGCHAVALAKAGGFRQRQPIFVMIQHNTAIVDLARDGN